MKKNSARFSIRTKLLLCFMAVIFVAAAIGTIGIVSVTNLTENGNRLHDNAVVKTEPTLQLLGMFQRARVVVRDLLEAEDDAEHDSERKSLEEKFVGFEAALNELSQGYNDDESHRMLQQIQMMYDRYKPLTLQVVEIADGGDHDGARALLHGDQMESVVSEMNKAVDAYAAMIALSGESIALANSESGSFNVNLIITVLLAGIALAVVISLLVANAISRPLQQTAEAARKLADGESNIVLNVRTRDETGMVAQAVQQAVASIDAMVQDADMLAQAAAEGHLSVRADAEMHRGNYRRIVEGVNHTLDNVVRPLNTAAAQLARLSRGVDMEELNLEDYTGDFRIIIDNLIEMNQSLNRMLDDITLLSKAARLGQLDTRADITHHNGGYQGLVKGINEILDAVVSPINEASDVLAEMAQGNLSVSVQGDYRGDHARIKDALNGTLSTLHSYVGEISSVLNDVADGRLTVGIDNDYRGDFAPIKEALNNIVDSLNIMMAEIAQAADQVADGSRQMADGSQELSQGATEQASAVEQLTQSLTDIAKQTKDNALNAGRARELAAATGEAARQGNAHMDAMLVSMQQINDSSASISKIIKVIDDIAFQTNLLALNAAVEAARAGQHGKGFAVVAEEVRNLAGRSAKAAQETTVMIESSVQKTGAGMKIAGDTAAALKEIVDEVTQVNDLVQGIAQASGEQATAVAQVNQGIEQVSQVVQTTSATAEEVAATSEELSGQAETFKQLVGRFELRDIAGALERKSKKPAALPEPNRRARPKISFDESDFGKY